MLVGRRGPDSQKAIDWPVPSSPTSMHASLFSSVLHLRGMDTVAQPLTDPATGSLFCWNGELFSEASGLQIPPEACDTHVLFDRIFNAEPRLDRIAFQTSLLTTLSTLRGPWAILVYHAPTSTLYFGRDVLGRRSLVMHFPSVEESAFWISSVAGCIEERSDSVAENGGADDASEASNDQDFWWGDADGFWHEVPANGIYSVCLKNVDLSAGKEDFKRHLVHHPWILDAESSDSAMLAPPTNSILNKSIPISSDLSSYDQLTNASESVEIPDPATEASRTALRDFSNLLSESVSARVQTITQQAQMHQTDPEPLAVLFSGGLDCMVLAAFAAKHLPTGSCIDLLNVAFDNPRVRKAAAEAAVVKVKKEKKTGKKQHGVKTRPSVERDPVLAVEDPVPASRVEASPPPTSSGSGYPSHLFAVPDRKTGLKGFDELKRTYPDIAWRFVEIDIEFEEAQETKAWIMGLVCPLESVMDLSIAMAFWFAARGRGAFINDAGERVPYETTAKVLLSGLGADEQLGGYNRHRKHFDISSWTGLLSELQKDVSRISKRNLGRDDRIVSDHGREIRFPYLSEAVISFLSAVPVQIKTDPRLGRGVGDKLLLRQMAVSLGLGRASLEVKRAVQFGARTAKMIDGREKGTMGVSV
ncbi:Asparagine synthetase domain-containing protein 1 [Podochytrium sp. JEL0797]|nr:Asparagine synthetase domain-containing protein 1 [Podochytrium sp. JEL0797]